MHVSLANLVLVCFIEHVDAMQTLDSLLQLLVVVQVVVQNFVYLILELLLEVFLLADLCNSLRLFLLHTLASKLEILDNQAQILIDDEKVFGLIVHLGLLLLQTLNNLHTRSNTRLQLLDLVVEDEFEFLQLLRLLPVLVNLHHFVLDGALALLQLILHRLDVLLLSVRVCDFSVESRVLLRLDLDQVLHLLLLVAELVTNQRQLTLLLHALVDLRSQIVLVFFLDDLDLLPSLVLDILTLLLVTLDHLLDLETQVLLLAFQLLALQDLIPVHSLHERLVLQIRL